MFTDRQKEIAVLLLQGLEIKEIASKLNMSNSTTYNEIGRMKNAAQVDNQWKLLVFLGNKKEQWQ